MKTVLNTENFNILQNPMFLGKDLGLQRYDIIKYPVFDELYDRQWSFLWFPREVNLLKDVADYKLLDERERFIFDSNLSFQTMGDSMLSRSIHQIMDRVTNSELESCMNVWSVFEDIHSRSYTHILKNVYPNATEFFNGVQTNKEILKRADFFRSKFDHLLNPSEADPRQQIFDAIVGTQIMEGVIFYSSFACSFYFGYRKKMEGNAKIIGFIARDENLHVAITQNILKYLRDNPAEGFQDIVKNSEEKVYEAYKLAVKSEHEWVDYLFSKGSLVGLTAASLKQYVEWLADSRLTSMGYKKIFNAKTNPLGGWLNSFYDSKQTQVAPQETEISSYTKSVAASTGQVDWKQKFKKL